MTHYWFISDRKQSNSKLALIAFLFAFFVISLGAFTRLTNAGLSCPDWPHCYGYITAPHTVSQLEGAQVRYPALPVDITKAWTEMTHRYCAGLESILILILAYHLLFKRQIRTAKTIFIAICLLSLLGLQVALGAFTVTEKLKPVIVLSHLLTGISILSLLWWTYIDGQLPNQSGYKLNISLLWLWLAFLVVAMQIALGGWVSTHYAGLACVDFPYCKGVAFPTLHLAQFNSDLITIHMLHRIGAIVTAAYISLLALFFLTQRAFRAFGLLLLALISLQLCLGILNIIWLRPVWIALMHQAVAIIILLTIIATLVKAYAIKGNRYGSWLT